MPARIKETVRKAVTAAVAAVLALTAAAAQAAEARAPRLITLAPHITEIVFAAGAGEHIIATVNSSNFPEAASAIPRIGDGLSISAERLIALQPDVVAAWQHTLPVENLGGTLARLGIPLAYSAPARLDDIASEIRRFGKMLGTMSHADRTANGLEQRLGRLQQRYAGARALSVFIEVGTGPLYTLGNDTLTNDALAHCAGINAFADSALVAPTVTVESVLARNPDVVIVASRRPGTAQERMAHWRRLGLPAAIRHHVFAIHPDELLRPGPRLIDATETLCNALEEARADLP